MSAIAKKDNAYKKMYNLLIDFELKIATLSKVNKQRKSRKKKLTSANEIDHLKLHRKLLKNTLKWMKTANSNQRKKYTLEIQTTFKNAKKLFLKVNEEIN
ncbi:MAG: hypothetical protein ACI9XO_004517 [Paraglaciecola sp.]|jgi:hypothetical protein